MTDDLKKGTRIRLLEMPEDPNPIPLGTEGTVTLVTVFRERAARDWAQIQVRWDNGSMLSLCVPPDRYEVIS